MMADDSSSTPIPVSTVGSGAEPMHLPHAADNGKEDGRPRIAFVPLEANPENLSELAHSLGLSPALTFCDVFSLTEPEMLAFIPRPALALLLVFPITPAYEASRAEEDAGKEVFEGKGNTEPMWMRQTIRNACGTMGLLHAMFNGTPRDFISILPLPMS